MAEQIKLDLNRVFAAAVLTFVAAGTGLAGADPAVSGPGVLVEGSVSAAGADGRSVQAFLAGGALYAPAGELFGFELHVLGGLGLDDKGPEEAVTGEAVFFWRNPNHGYAGVAAFGFLVGRVDFWGGGLVGGAYLSDWDLGASGGVEGGDGVRGGVFGINAGWYPSETLRIGLEGTAGTSGVYDGATSVQWQPFDPASNWILRFHGGGGAGDGGFYFGGIGVQYRFGAPKSLKRQLREDRL